jgi:hypothetical protein
MFPSATGDERDEGILVAIYTRHIKKTMLFGDNNGD